MYNDNLKATVEANKLAISAMQAQLLTVGAEVEKTNIEIQKRVNIHFRAADADVKFIPVKMLSSFNVHISESLIRIGWNDYSKPERVNSIDIYYYSDKSWENNGAEGNHRWEISCSSTRLIVNTTEAGWAKQDGEDIDRARLVLGLFGAIERTSKHLIDYHKMYIENRNKAYTIHNAISSLERNITDAEKQIERNNYVRLFKPGGETAVCKFNTDIKPVESGYYYASRRNHISFDAVNLLKETAKGIRVEFIKYSPATENTEAQRWVNGTKWLSLNQLISLFHELNEKNKRDLKRKEEREAKEAKEKEEELLKSKTA